MALSHVIVRSFTFYANQKQPSTSDNIICNDNNCQPSRLLATVSAVAETEENPLVSSRVLNDVTMRVTALQVEWRNGQTCALKLQDPEPPQNIEPISLQL